MKGFLLKQGLFCAVSERKRLFFNREKKSSSQAGTEQFVHSVIHLRIYHVPCAVQKIKDTAMVMATGHMIPPLSEGITNRLLQHSVIGSVTGNILGCYHT